MTRVISTETVSSWLDHAAFSPMDRSFAVFVSRLDGGVCPVIRLAAACVSRQLSQGHICLDLETPPRFGEDEEEIQEPEWPSADVWLRELKRSPVVGSPGDDRPLILESSTRLYLERYWRYEKSLADSIRRRCREMPAADPIRLREGLRRHFLRQEDGRESEFDHQKLAAFCALTRGLAIISGGPGTGKTTTVRKILAILLELSGGKTPRVFLTAPTGKAAMRLRETIRIGLEQLPVAAGVRQEMLSHAATIHRLLGPIHGSPDFRHHADRLLPVDVVVVDEASMVDLPLMARLFEAIPVDARIILLGDHDQLASVQAGSVFGDITLAAGAGEAGADLIRPFCKLTNDPCPDIPAAHGTARLLANHVITLRRNYRFGKESGIARVCSAVRRGRADEAIAHLQEGSLADIHFNRLPQPEDLARVLRPRVLEGFADYLKAATAEEMLQHVSKFRLLCALRHGPYGLHALNALVEDILHDAGLLGREGKPYPRMPILITQNDYNLRLFNGDSGVLFQDKDRHLAAGFLDDENRLRTISLFRLPPFEKAFAMTVHKSQGSEFDEVLLVLPDRDLPVLTRELVYTGISRARKKVAIMANPGVFAGAVNRKIERNSGLMEKLQSDMAGRKD